VRAVLQKPKACMSGLKSSVWIAAPKAESRRNKQRGGLTACVRTAQVVPRSPAPPKSCQPSHPALQLPAAPTLTGVTFPAATERGTAPPPFPS